MKRYDAARRSMALGMAVMMGVGGITGCGQKETKTGSRDYKRSDRSLGTDSCETRRSA